MRKFNIIILAALLSAFATGCAKEQPAETTDPLEGFYQSVTADYPKTVMDALSGFGTDPGLGFRTSGSVAELAAADYLCDEMENIGLENVTKDRLTVDSWEFTGAKLSFADSDGTEKEITMASYQTQFECDGEELPLIYAGKGTAADYEGVDAEGKLVLIDINQAEDWRINWPAYQAKLKGAAAVIAVNTGGYYQYDKDTLGVSDIRGPSDAPAFTVTVRDGDTLKKLIADSPDGEIKVALTANSSITHDAETYAITGEIVGATDETICVAAHYDGYFHSFEDDASGVGAVLGIAKALKDSGYAPRKTIRFILHPAGEWGLDGSRYDSAAGARLTLDKHPEWAESAFALISIDGGVTCAHADGIKVTASAELSDFAMKTGYDVEGAPFDKFEAAPLAEARTEAFPYARKGIPALCSGFSGVDEQMADAHHTNMDTSNYFYNEDAVVYSQKLYGAYVIALDRLAVKPLDYAMVFDDMLKKADLKATPNGEAFQNAVYGALDASEKLNAIIEKSDWSAGNAGEVNSQLFRISKAIQDKLMSLTWKDEIVFAFERYQRNAEMIAAAAEALKKGNAGSAVNDCLSEVDIAGYARYFDRETYDYFVNQVIGPDAVNSWGSGYIGDNVDLYNVIQAIITKSKAPGRADYSAELEALDIELIKQQKMLRDTIGQMTKDVISITKMMDSLTVSGVDAP